MTISDAAEQALFGKSLEEKLSVAPIDLQDISRPSAISSPAAPHRPSELALSANGVRANFPGVNALDQDRPRGELLHFLANHELLASELMALVLLKFPDAPDAYRRGVYEAMREEQMHTLMYIRRMKDCGVEFGQLPLNSYFWRLVSPMKSPMEFVTKLNLTFEQANLDFSKHYAKLFRQAGDHSTASVLDKIYQDEIGHVGHGIHWLREWKEPNTTDWQTYCQSLELPFSASKAKGMAPYNPAGRRLAGLDEDFIAKLAVYSQSRGRKPVLHWFNPNAESSARAHARQLAFSPNKPQRQIESDLEFAMIAACKQDDMLLLRQMPTVEHLTLLQDKGLTLPELNLVSDPSLDHREIGGLVPWAWAPDASLALRQFKDLVPASVAEQWRPALSPQYFSKLIGVDLIQHLELPSETMVFYNRQDAEEYLSQSENILRLKHPYACSGRGHFVYTPSKGITPPLSLFLDQAITHHGAIIVEPERERICDFSAHYDLHTSGARFRGFCVMENTPSGQFIAAHSAHKWTSLLPEGVAPFLYQQPSFTSLFNERIPEALASLLPDYQGPVGIDAMVYRNSDGSLTLTPIVEVNVRHTMGRLALNLHRQLNKKNISLHILPKSSPPPTGATPLNDPSHAQLMQAWLTGI